MLYIEGTVNFRLVVHYAIYNVCEFNNEMPRTNFYKDSDLLNLHLIICIVDNQSEIDSSIKIDLKNIYLKNIYL